MQENPLGGFPGVQERSSLDKVNGSGDGENLEGFERYSSDRINRTLCYIGYDGESGGIKVDFWLEQLGKC